MRLDELSIRALHRLDAAHSRLRHSIVETCFHNLRILAQELPGRRGNGDFARNLAEALGNVTVARKLIDEHFAYEVRPGVAIADLFPQQSCTIVGSLQAIEALAAKGIPPRENQRACEEFSERVVKGVDELLGAIDAVKNSIIGMRISPRKVLDELVSMERPLCEEKGVRLELEDRSDSRLEVFGCKEELLNALGELVRNALRHAFPDGRAEGGRITIRLSADQFTRDTIIAVCDNGRGMAPEQLARVGAAGASAAGSGDGVGVVRRIVERGHLGLVTYESAPGRGTCVQVRLPRRAEPGLEAEPMGLEAQAAAEPPLEVALVETGPSAARIAAAILVAASVIAVGVCLALLVMRLQQGR